MTAMPEKTGGVGNAPLLSAKKFRGSRRGKRKADNCVGRAMMQKQKKLLADTKRYIIFHTCNIIDIIVSFRLFTLYIITL